MRMTFYRIQRLLTYPFAVIFARMAPVTYARLIGVRINGRVTIFGSSYTMFSAEPYLVTLEDNVFISVDAKFICHDGGVLPFRKEQPSLDLAAPISVGENTFIGTQAAIMKGVRIGRNCIVGAFSVVTRDVPDGQIVAGNPAKIVKTTAEYLAKAQENSLGIGHLTGNEKVKAYKTIFGLSK
jgi:acetyltransferase-like isoleucine patch superfamily enzyme